MGRVNGFHLHYTVDVHNIIIYLQYMNVSRISTKVKKKKTVGVG